jgi:hypothetical protein
MPPPFFGGGTVGWTQALRLLGRGFTIWATPPVLFCVLVIFEIGVSIYSWANLFVLPSIAGGDRYKPPCPASHWLKWGLMNFLPRLAFNHMGTQVIFSRHPLSSWDYRSVPPCLVYKWHFKNGPQHTKSWDAQNNGFVSSASFFWFYSVENSVRMISNILWHNFPFDYLVHLPNKVI